MPVTCMCTRAANRKRIASIFSIARYFHSTSEEENWGRAQVTNEGRDRWWRRKPALKPAFLNSGTKRAPYGLLTCGFFNVGTALCLTFTVARSGVWIRLADILYFIMSSIREKDRDKERGREKEKGAEEKRRKGRNERSLVAACFMRCFLLDTRREVDLRSSLWTIVPEEFFKRSTCFYLESVVRISLSKTFEADQLVDSKKKIALYLTAKK